MLGIPLLLHTVEFGRSNSSGRHYMIHGHNMSQWVKTTDLCFKTDSKSVIFSDGSYYDYLWKSEDEVVSTVGPRNSNPEP